MNHETMTIPGERLLARADLLLGLARAFALPTPAGLVALEDVAAVSDDLTTAAGVRESAVLAASQRDAARAARAVGVEAWAAEHQRLFACGVVCPIHETGYIRRDKGHILGDIAGFYLAFGVALRAEEHERLDHLVAELEFMGALLVMFARARAEGQGGAAEVTGTALRDFAQDHLGDWLPGFARRLASTTELPVYVHLADALAHAWAGIAADLGVDSPGERLPMAESDPGTPYECDMAGADL